MILLFDVAAQHHSYRLNYWGKVNNLNAQRIRKMYGPKVDEWILARCRLIPKEMLPVFTNSFMEETGLDTIISIA